jgi:hypothetical protein
MLLLLLLLIRCRWLVLGALALVLRVALWWMSWLLMGPILIERLPQQALQLPRSGTLRHLRPL